MKNKEHLFSQIERYKVAATILFRSIELKLLNEKVGRFFESNKSILDLGCGDGIADSVIFDKPIYGLDNNAIAVKEAEKSGVYKKVFLADAGNIPLPDNCLDLVLSNCSLEHMENLDSVLKEISRILVKDGLFIFTTPSHNFKNYSFLGLLGLKRLARSYGALRDKRQHHYHSHSLEDWSLILAKFNLKTVDGYYYLDKKILEFWDFLLILYLPFSLLTRLGPKVEALVNKIHYFLFYKIFFRKTIYQKFLASEITGSDGAVVCVIAKKETYV